MAVLFFLKVAVFFWCRREAEKKDLSLERRRSGSSAVAAEFFIIATATSHLATGYTIAMVALATAWSPRRARRRGECRETGRQME